MRVSTGCDAPIGKESSTCCSVPSRPESRAIAYSMQAHSVQQKPNKHAAMRRVGERTEIVRYSITYAPSPAPALDLPPSLIARETRRPDVRAKVRMRARGPWRRCVRGPRRTAAHRRPDPGSFRPRSLIVPARARECCARPVGDETSFRCDLARAGAFGELLADPALLTPRVARGEVPMLDGLASRSKKFRCASAQGLSCIRGPCFLHATAKRGEGGAGQKVRCLSLPRHDQGPRRAGRFFGCGQR